MRGKGNAQTTLPHGSDIAGELLIAPPSGVSDSELEGVYNGHGGQQIRSLSQINVSLGGTSYSSTFQNAVNYAWSKDVVVVAAADSTDAPASFSNFSNWIVGAAAATTTFLSQNSASDMEIYVERCPRHDRLKQPL